MELAPKTPISQVENPLCTVCIANYNGETLLGDCLDSVLTQDCDCPVEVIVHDDASTDVSVAFLREYYPQVKVLISDRNVGFSVANNRMVAQARGDYVLLLNNDAALYPDALTTLLHTAHEQATPGILSLPQYDWETGTLVDRGCLLDPFYNPVPNRNPERSEVAYVIGACLWIPRSLWNDLGGFPEWMESIAEDMYLCCLARLRGYTVRVFDSSGYRHRQGASFGGNRATEHGLQSTYRRRFLSERNKTSVMIICTPTVLIWPILAGHVLALCVEGLILSISRRDVKLWKKIYGPVLLGIFHQWSVIRNQREQIQSTARIRFLDYMRVHVWQARKVSMLLHHGFPKIT